jgi:hypothetical protein
MLRNKLGWAKCIILTLVVVSILRICKIWFGDVSFSLNFEFGSVFSLEVFSADNNLASKEGNFSRRQSSGFL